MHDSEHIYWIFRLKDNITDLTNARGGAGDEHDFPPQVLLPPRLHQRPHKQPHWDGERDVDQDDHCSRDVHQHAVKQKVEIHRLSP